MDEISYDLEPHKGSTMYVRWGGSPFNVSSCSKRAAHSAPLTNETSFM